MRLLAAIIVTLTAVTAAALTPPCPCILGVAPTFVRSSGGEVIALTGISFRSPARVFVDVDSKTIEAVVISVTQSKLQFIAPAIDMDGKQLRPTTIRAIFDSGTSREWKATSFIPLVYQDITLTPAILAVSPGSGPLVGGTRVTIFGEGFQEPLQVFFGDQQAQLINVSFSQIVAIAPAGSRVGPVDVRVVNINSNTSTVTRDAYRYLDSMRITSITPNTGPTSGGTRVTIRGSGFNDPVAITIAGHIALPLRISGTEILAITTPIIGTQPCVNVTGPVVVTNIENGDQTTGPLYTYTCTPRRRVGR